MQENYLDYKWQKGDKLPGSQMNNTEVLSARVETNKVVKFYFERSEKGF